MKRLILFLAAIIVASEVAAQTRTAYLDLYQRGGAMHLKTTLTFDNIPIYVGKKNMGDVLNTLAEYGWEVNKVIPVQRHPFFSFFSRHKFHIILKKEYTEGENPFRGLASLDVYKSHGSTYSDYETDSPYTTQSDNATSENFIAAYKFQGRRDISDLIVPDNIEVIGIGAYYNCSNLTKLTIPASVTKINPYAFGACKRLNEIYCKSPVAPAISPTTFQGLPKSAVIYVPAEAAEEYRQAPGWEKYADRIMPFHN